MFIQTFVETYFGRIDPFAQEAINPHRVLRIYKKAHLPRYCEVVFDDEKSRALVLEADAEKIIKAWEKHPKGTNHD